MPAVGMVDHTAGRSRPRSVRHVPLSRGRRAVLVVSLLAGLLFSTVDTSIVSTSLVTISKELDDFINSPWVILSYLLTYMGFAVCIAKLSDIYGRRNMVVVSWVIFIAFSMASALSQTMIQLIVFRAFQGLGGSGLYSLTQIGLIEVGPVHRPSLIGAMIGVTLAVAFVTGPIVGGLISHYSNWRWIFNINIPFGLVTILGIVSCWPEEHVSNLFSWTAFKTIDFVGGTALLCASGFLVFGLQHGGTILAGWDDPAVIAAFVIASFGWVLFFLWETALSLERLAKIQPMFPIRLVTRRVYMGALLVTLLTGFPHVALTVVLPERFQIVNGEDAFMAGLHLLPLLGACAVGSFVAGAISSKKNHTSATLIAASALQLIGVGLMAMLDEPESDVSSAYGYQAVFGLGVGLSYGAATILTGIHASDQGDLAVAQGAVAQARVLGGCIGIASCTVIFNSHVNNGLREHLSEPQLLALHKSPLAVKGMTESLQMMVKKIYAAAFAQDSTVMAFVCTAMFVISFLTIETHPTPLERLTHKPPLQATESTKDLTGFETEMSDMGSVRSV